MRVLYVDEWDFYALKSRLTFLILGVFSLEFLLGFSYSWNLMYSESEAGFAVILVDVLGVSFCVLLFLVLLWKVRRFGADLVYLRIGYLLLFVCVVLNGFLIWYTYYMSSCGAFYVRILYVKAALLAFILYLVQALIFLFLKVALDFDLVLKGKISDIPRFFDRVTLNVECDASDESCIVSLSRRLLYVALVLVFIVVGYSSWYIISSLFVDVLSILSLLLVLYLLPISIVFENKHFLGLLKERIHIQKQTTEEQCGGRS